jgi:hypothetical protein
VVLVPIPRDPSIDSLTATVLNAQSRKFEDRVPLEGAAKRMERCLESLLTW